MGRTYASALTKEDLQKLGVNNVTEDGHVFVNGIEKKLSINKQGYLCVTLVDKSKKYSYVRDYKWLNANGKVRITRCKTYRYGSMSCALSRIMWAWFKGEVKAGMVIDHKDNHHTERIDYRLDNLQEITPQKNVTKDKEIKHGVYIPAMAKNKQYTKEYILNKLEHYTALYEKAKQRKDAHNAKNYRCARSQWRRRFEILFGDVHVA